jgi:deoxyribodipyrimidine photo-lyase
MSNTPVSIHWFRRDLRLEDNASLYTALKSKHPVIPIFIFDREILDKLEDKKDARVQFIHRELEAIRKELKGYGSDMVVRYGKPIDVWKNLTDEYEIKEVYTNRDYEPYAVKRDGLVSEFLISKGISFTDVKDHVIFDRDEIVKDNGEPYVVYTPYSKKWLSKLTEKDLQSFDCAQHYDRFYQFTSEAIPSLKDMGFKSFEFTYPDREIDIDVVKKYATRRDIPSVAGTSRISMHLRFGTISIRKATRIALEHSKSWLNELIWRNFYQAIIWHYPHVAESAFRPKYDRIPWRNNQEEFQAWCDGKTGYPIVDAGMRELNATGFMHNRVRMIVASFLTKHLLIDWRWGEAYFAKKLLDFELASNNGGWQWASGSGCDAAPYFRVFNPELQSKKFDPENRYIKKWVPEFQESKYAREIVVHKMARERAINIYKSALS